VKPVAKKTTPVIKAVAPAHAIQKETHPALMQLNKMGMHNADWLLKQTGSDWTLQLLGARDPETLLSFSRQHNLGSAAVWYKTWLDQQPYYVIVYGRYSSRDNAREAIAKLPEKLRAIKPWAKSMKSAQDAVK
jgi:DamX protein